VYILNFDVKEPPPPSLEVTVEWKHKSRKCIEIREKIAELELMQ
jgi:hypothetical protein